MRTVTQETATGLIVNLVCQPAGDVAPRWQAPLCDDFEYLDDDGKTAALDPLVKRHDAECRIDPHELKVVVSSPIPG